MDSIEGITVIPHLASQRLTLRAPAPGDAEQIYKLMNDWEVVRMLSRLPFPYPRQAADEWIGATAEQAARMDGYHFVVTGEEDGREILVGCVGLTLDAKTRSAELGYWVGRRFWGHGVAQEAARRVLTWAFAHLPLDTVEAFVSVDNPASAAVLRKIGMRHTGTGERPFLARGGAHPVLIFSANREDVFGVIDAGPAPEGGGTSLLLVAACALIDSDNRVLLARRPEGKKMAGLWEFPGGKLAPGETPEAALIRELREELGIDVSASCLAPFAFASHAYPGFHLLMPLFVCRRWQGFVQPLEGQTLAWVRPGKLQDYEMPAADKPLVPLLRDLL